MKIHKKNFELIEKHKLRVGNKFKLKVKISNFEAGEKVTIKFIHSSYGWILFKETEQLPQEVEKLKAFIDLDYKKNNSLGCGRKKRDFICGVANAWGYERLCQSCDLKLKEQWRKKK